MVSAVEDVVELRDGIAAFDTYWHNALEEDFYNHDSCHVP